MRNPTGTMFEFLDPDFPNPILHTQNVLEAIGEHGINLVVIGPQLFEPPLPRILTTALDRRFPDSERVGHFEVRWKR